MKQFGFYVDASEFESPSGEEEKEDARRWIAAVSEILSSDIVKAVMAGIERQENEKARLVGQESANPS